MKRFGDAAFLRAHIEEAQRVATRLVTQRIADDVKRTVYGGTESRLESPLEAVFYVWWYVLCRYAATEDGSINECIQLDLQREVELDDERFRLDFVVEPTPSWLARINGAQLSWKPIAVEVDGHEFHEKTRQQVTYRNRRDRLLQIAGWTVFHISFDEMNKQTGRPVYEVITAAMDQVLQLSKAIDKYAEHKHTAL